MGSLVGITEPRLRFLMNSIEEAGLDRYGVRLLELGAQVLRPRLKRSIPHKTSRDLFRSLGINYTSIDLNGRRGALKLNLARPIKGLGTFDVITNFGTSEHVKDQYSLWRNVHELCAVGGVVVSVVPLFGSFRMSHAFYRYTPFFFHQLADYMSYELISCEITPSHWERRNYVQAAYRKWKEMDFIGREGFRAVGRNIENVTGVYEEMLWNSQRS